MSRVDDTFDSEAIDARNRWGQTRLLRAAERGDLQHVKKLVEEGADISLFDNEKATARITARRNGHKEIEKYLSDLEEERGMSPETLAEKARLAFEASEAVKKMKAQKEAALAEQKEKEKLIAAENKAVWFYSNDLEEREGPISIKRLRELHSKGEIGSDTLVWSPDTNDWKPFFEVADNVGKYTQAIGPIDQQSKSESITQHHKKPITAPVASEEKIGQSADSSESGFFTKLSNGDFGLAKTYWLYGVLVGVIANVLANVITSIAGLVVFMVVYTAYEIPVLMGIWRASGKYQGPSIWAVLAKIAVILGAIMLVAGLLVIAGLLKNA